LAEETTASLIRSALPVRNAMDATCISFGLASLEELKEIAKRKTNIQHRM
jgi:hypothetical protein